MMKTMKRVRDPIHDYIQLSQAELALVNTSQFQRLRGIRQLGLAYLVYPGANHTRFEHSLGTCHLARELARASDLEPDQVILAGLSGLLHDLGHGPYSHLSEVVEGLPTHEEVTLEKLRTGPLSETLRAQDLDHSALISILEGRHFLSPLITSELDADRMDYLARDAYYCGVTIGADLGRLVATLKLRDDRLQVSQNGLPAVEALLVARHIMYPVVYFHPTARAGELLVARAVAQALEQGALTPDVFFDLDEGQLLALLEAQEGQPARAIADLRARRLPKAVVELDRKVLSSERLEELVDRSVRTTLERELAEAADLEPEQLWVDLPPPQDVSNTFRLCVRQGDSSTCRSLEQASTLAHSLFAAQFDHWRLRVYASRDIRSRWEDLARLARRRLVA